MKIDNGKNTSLTSTTINELTWSDISGKTYVGWLITNGWENLDEYTHNADVIYTLQGWGIIQLLFRYASKHKK